MEIVLGVSMTPTAVRMVLVEGSAGDGVTVDTTVLDLDADAGADPVEQVVAAILGTRESAAEGGHRLMCVGVAWADHGSAARLRIALRRAGVDDVVMVSELHAAAALAQAIGRKTDCDRTALLFCERESATVAVVRTADRVVVGVQRRGVDDAADMVADLENSAQPPQAVFVVGAGVEIAEVSARVAARTALPVHAPGDADLALARGAALAAAGSPRYEAETVGLGDSWEALKSDLTAAGPTQLAAAGYLGYSAVEDDDAGGDADHMWDTGFDDAEDADVVPTAEGIRDDRKPFLLVGSALGSVFVVGVAALAVSLAVTIRPTAEQRPDPPASGPATTGAPAADTTPETIQAPIPVVQEAPRAVVARPAGPAVQPAPAPAAPPVTAWSAPAPAAPPPAAPPPAAPAPAAPAPAPAAPAPAPAVAPAPAPVVAPVAPPIVIAPVLPPLLSSILQPPVRLPQIPRTTSAPPATTAPMTPTSTAIPTYQSSTPTATPTLPTYTPTYTQTPAEQEPAEREPAQAPSTTAVVPPWPFGAE